MTLIQTPAPPEAAPRRPGSVSFVGGGPGDPALLTVRAAKLLAEADVVVADTSDSGDAVDSAELVRRYARQDVRLVMVDPGGAKAAAELVSAAGDGARVVRVVDGDITAAAGLVDEVGACREAGVDIEIVPGVPVATAVPAYAGVPLSSGCAPGKVLVVCAGDREQMAELTPGADTAHDTVVVLGDPADIAAAAVRLGGEGWPMDTPALIVRNATTLSQTSRVMTLDQVSAALSSAEAPVTLVVGCAVSRRDSLAWFETRPLFAWRVLVPRTKDQAGPALDRLAEYGAHAEVVPTISIEEPRTPAHMDRAVTGLVTGRYEWVGFTSVNAVRAVRDRLAALGLDARALSGLKVAAVGGVTAESLREWGIQPDLVPSGEQSAHGLLMDWPAYDKTLDPIDRVLLPRADIATETLVAGLQELGWEVDDVTAYRTVRASPPPAPVREAIKAGAFDAVLFTSSSTVRNLIGIAGKPHPATVVACIGPNTARTAREQGLRVDVLAPETSGISLVDALAEYGASRRREALAAGEEPLRPSQQRRGARRRSR